VVPFADSEELLRTSGLPASAMIEVGTDHRLADLEPLTAMLTACEKAGTSMTGRAPPRRRGSYGIDAPFAPAFIAVVAVAEFVLAIFTGKIMPLLCGLFILAILGFYLHFTLRGKFVVWAELLDKAGLRGDERILDLGCGRGAVLLMAAQHLTTGRAVGVDLWRSADQSGNSAEATRRNAIAEGVADRVELHTGDMTALPFEDNIFDYEAVRVLRPGGRLMIADIRGTRHHQAQLAKLDMSNVTRCRLGWRFLFLVTATKPELRS
jgi:arsenite methyltransferase